MKTLTIILRNMRRQLRRTILTVLTIALATFIFTVLIAVPASMDHIIHDASQTLRLSINNRTGPWYGLPARYCDQIEAMPGVTGCVPLTGFPSYYRDPRDEVGAFAIGEHQDRVFPDYGITPESMERLRKVRRGAVAGEALMKKYGWHVGQQVTLKSASADLLELPFVIVGVSGAKRYPNMFIFQREYLKQAQEKIGSAYEDSWFLMARVDSAERLGQVAHQIDETFRNTDYETRTQSESDALSDGLSAIGSIRGIIYSLCAIVMLTVLMIAANSMAMMVRDRLSEVAVMRALGFPLGQIAVLLFGECALIGVVGGALGAGLALIIFHGATALGPVLNGVGYLSIAPREGLVALIVAIVLSLLSGALPTFSALRITPAEAFRQVV